MRKISLHIILAIIGAFAALSALFIYYSAEKYSQFEKTIIEQQARDYSLLLQDRINTKIKTRIAKKCL